MLKTILQTVGIFLAVQFVTNQFFGKGSTSAGKPAVPDFAERPAVPDADAEYARVPNVIAPMWSSGSKLDLRVYVSPSMVLPSLSSMPSDSLVVDEQEFGFGNYSDKREIHVEFPVPEAVQNNGTLWAHYFVAQSGFNMDPAAKDYDIAKAYNFARPLTQVLVKKRQAKLRNLLEKKNMSEEEAREEEELAKKPKEWASYYHSNFSLNFIPDSGTQNYPQMHPSLIQFIQLDRTGARDASGQNGWYFPILYPNTFWQLRDQMLEINQTVKQLPLNIQLSNLPNWRYTIFASVDEGMKATQYQAAQGNAPATGDGSEFEEFKRILLDSNTYLLGLTFVVSVFHMIFEFLAFKNDVSHWRKKKDNVGTSFRTIVANVVMQTIIFLYLMDNNENTSWMILFSQGMGIAVEAWKITKTVNIRVRPTAPGSFLPYSVVFEDKHKLSETEKKTEEADAVAFKYLYRIAVPLLFAYAGYSLYYETHKSWYSFIIATLVGSVYAYGFLMMVPSLYINYRLKSIAHMPGKAMMYKVLSTFIDDLFAFTIKMPTLHRLATLRDDVIFFIYLYQRWAYRIDYTRVNEFGQGGDDEEEDAKEAAKPLAAPADAASKGAEAAAVSKSAEAVASGKEKKEKPRKRK
ncbi:cleft lip and palate transmembrane 1 [Eremomyces bilateralis CBS 781.70]|uniref:Cleft lip and palate transmembrane 1 n=1 Tax=Eremomyces bilateralis CBS 781.70 TaxID=1392243 RepID=A0A6G1FW62_9PEZI|nr:cleft lip and palate transmembrane 1 [Eremomyces bilateralis CBS 781.70]KAF1810024.1 cleft lip and palate transmembrane 1 [Eremomyces bilateralis CBS 781.70]